MLIEELRDLRYFVEVARCQSFSSAAIRLSVSPGTISKAVARLEEHMATALFARSSRAMRLTPEGEKLFERVDSACHALETAWMDHATDDGEISGTVHLSTFSMYGRTHLARLLPDFLTRHPGIKVVVSAHDNWRSTNRERADIRITWNEPLDENKVAHNLAPQRFIMVASPGYLEHRGTPRSIADLDNHDCIGGVSANGGHIQWHFKSVDDGNHSVFLPKGRVALMEEMSMAIQFAENGLGITLVDPEDVLQQIDQRMLVRVLESHLITTRSPEANDIVLQFTPRHRLGQAANLLVDHIMEYHSLNRPA